MTLVVRLDVTNTGQRQRNPGAFLRAVGIGAQRSPIGLLGPGQTAVRSFEVRRDVMKLSGQKLYVGVDELDGPPRLTHAIQLPIFR